MSALSASYLPSHFHISLLGSDICPLLPALLLEIMRALRITTFSQLYRYLTAVFSH